VFITSPMARPLGHTDPYHDTKPVEPLQRPVPEAVRIKGTITRKEMKSVTRHVRSGHVGPTSVYYAGVTAPAIAAGMASLVGASLTRAGLSDYWVLMASSLIAAMAGITWYLIFMRWSYRHDFGRSGEMSNDTMIEADESGVYWTRGNTRTMVHWQGISKVELSGGFIRLHVEDGDDFFMPKSWFESRKARRDMYHHLVKLRDHALEEEALAA